MIDPIGAYALGPLANLELVHQVVAPLPLPEVSSADQARFQAALRPSQDAAAGLNIHAWSNPRSDILATPGDAILQSLERLRANYRAVGAALETTAREALVSPQQLLGLQMQMAQVTLGTQLISQVASKLEQHINTLIKAS